MNKRNSVYLLGIGAVLLAALAFITSKPTVETQVRTAQVNHDFVDNKDSAVELVIFDYTQKTENLVSSLMGTHHGVSLKSRNQQLIITASLKDLFDYYMSAAGEETTAEIDQRVQAELARQLQTSALAQAISIWHNYLAYKRELVEFDQQYPAHSSQPEKLKQLQLLQQRQLALIALQDQIFGASTAEILFRFDRQLDGYTLEKAELFASDLSAEQIQQRLVNLSAQLPIETVLSLQRNNQQKALMEIDQQEELNAQQKFEQREQHVGAAAAGRLQELEEKRAAWNARMVEFKQQKQILEQAGLANEEYKTSLNTLYTQHFSENEQLRARALSTHRE
jgi:lipase chaperone LimK